MPNISIKEAAFRNILHCTETPITFLSNPKVACSTIKNSLLGGMPEANVHREAELKFSYPCDGNHAIFCLTRNPYSRALSCFKNKIGAGKETTGNVWLPFARKFGFSVDDTPSFYEFLSALADKQHNQEFFDIHFKPQIYNLHHDDITPSYIGRFEHFGDLERYLAQFKIPLVTRNPRPTNASTTYQHEISPDEAFLIEEVYHNDFQLLGYEPNLESDFQPKPIHQAPKISQRYLHSFRLLSLGLDDSDLKKAANQAERTGNVNKAIQLVEVLSELQPHSKKIKRRIKRLIHEKANSSQNRAHTH